MTRWYKNGQLEERCNYTNDVRDGVFERWYENGQLAERGHFKLGKPDGEFSVFDENGTPVGVVVRWSQGKVLSVEKAGP